MDGPTEQPSPRDTVARESPREESVRSSNEAADAVVTPLRPIRRRRQIAIAIGVVTVCVVSVSAMIVMALMEEQPAWWRSVDQRDTDTQEEGAFVENYVISVASRSRELTGGASEPWAVSVVPEQANAWLNTRLPDWVENQQRGVELFGHIRELQVEFRDDVIIAGVRLHHRGTERVFSASLRPEVREDQSLWMIAEHVHIGRLTVPASWVLPRLLNDDTTVKTVARDEAGDEQTRLLREIPEVRGLAEALLGQRPMAEEPLLQLPDGRQVRLEALSAYEKDGERRLSVRCRTEDRGPKTPDQPPAHGSE